MREWERGELKEFRKCNKICFFDKIEFIKFIWVIFMEEFIGFVFKV